MSKTPGYITLITTCLTLAHTAYATDYMDRPARLKQLAGKLQALHEAEKATDIEKLLPQLQRKTCDVKLPAASTHTFSPTELYKKHRHAVIVVGSLYQCGHCDRAHSRGASGFLITENGVALTNYHVIEAITNGPIGAMTYDGNVYAVNTILAADRENDIAVIKLEGTNFEHVSLSTDEPVGSDVWIISHPGNQLYLFTTGMISSYFETRRTGKSEPIRKWMSVTADFGKGSSGAPVFNAKGNVVGMVTSTNPIIATTSKKKSCEYAQMVVRRCVPAASMLRLFKKGASGF